jgi:hypothetical protein
LWRLPTPMSAPSLWGVPRHYQTPLHLPLHLPTVAVALVAVAAVVVAVVMAWGVEGWV